MGSHKRAQKRRVDRPGVLPPDPTTPKLGEAWVIELGRIALGEGHTARAAPARNIEALRDIDAASGGTAQSQPLALLQLGELQLGGPVYFPGASDARGRGAQRPAGSGAGSE